MKPLIQNIELKYDHLINSIATPILIIKVPEGSILLANLSAEDLLGYEREELKNTELYKLLDKEDQDRLIRLFQSEILMEKGTEHNLKFTKKSRKKLVSDITFQLQDIEGGKIFLITIHDITQLKKAENDLIKANALLQEKMDIIEKQNKDLVQVDKTKTKFLSLITHELKTPVSAMIGISELILTDPETNSDYLEMLQMAFNEGKKLLNLVEDILDFMSLISGKLKLHIAEEDLNLLVQTSIAAAKEDHKDLIKERNLQIHLKSTEKNLAFVDRERCLQVFGKIIQNSIKFNKPDGKIFITIANNETWTEVVIQDTGIGILEESIDKIFRGFEISGDIKSHKRGTGLGLPISKKLMEVMGGKLSIESKKDLGTSISLIFPRTKVLDEAFYTKKDTILLF